MRNEIRSYGPGKYNLVVDQYVHSVSLDGCDEECGSVQENGTWYGLLRASLLTDNDAVVDLNDAECKLLADSAGAIVSEDDQGFVDVAYYDSAEDMEADWQEIVDSIDSEEE